MGIGDLGMMSLNISHIPLIRLRIQAGTQDVVIAVEIGLMSEKGGDRGEAVIEDNQDDRAFWNQGTEG